MAPVSQLNNDEVATAGRLKRNQLKTLPVKTVTRVCNRDMRYMPIKKWGILR